jgi:GntR family transcriptional regulator
LLSTRPTHEVVAVGLLETAPPLDRQSSVPIFGQVRTLLEEAIARGELTANRRIPSERELSIRLGVSRMTVRQALLAMIADGIIYTRSGKGTYVAERKIEQPLQQLTSFSQDIVARGMRPSSRVLEAELLPAPLELAHALDIRPGAELVRIRRLRLADDEPVALETSHVPHAIAPGLLAHDLANRSLYELLRTKYGVEFASAKQTIEASEATAEERELLLLPRRIPVLRLHRFTSGVDGRVLEFVRAVYRGDRYQLHVELR